MIFDPLEFLARLAVLVHAPRVNLVHFHGVIGPAAKWRASMIMAATKKRDVLGITLGLL